MKILGHACICPMCRFAFTAYLADQYNPPVDEVAHDKRSLLCNVCDRAFLNTLFRVVQQEILSHGGLALDSLRLSALQQEAQRAGEPGQEAQAGTGETSSVSSGVQGLSHTDRDTLFQDRVPNPVGAPPDTL